MAIDLLECSRCQTDEHVGLVERLTGTQRRLKCAKCGLEWLRGEPLRPKIQLPTLEEIKKRFPQPTDVDPERLEIVRRLKTEFLRREPEPVPNVAPYWARYQQIFSAEGLQKADPQEFKDFGNSNVGANPGNMSVFNEAWKELGPEASAARVRKVVEYLLRGTSPVDLEDRLTALIQDTKPFGMKGFKESLLTKVLCIVYPQTYLTILKYTGEAGKREIALSLWGLELPDPEKVDWTIGRLILWSNDLLLALLGEGFRHQQHASEFLWWAKDKA
ncbi:hypothetical protein [Paenarthrobacter sp. CAP02]|uniref:hypothetical protein n=1 Tax=Paenarthrobacter sp. CAP02 TaxID=3158144 RepID=UPI0032DB9CCD